MVINKSLDDNNEIIITALLRDVQNAHVGVFSTRNLNLTLKKVEKRLSQEGMGFLTKSLPRLGKAFDRALCDSSPLNCLEHGFKPMPGTQLPKFLGELFREVLSPDGTVLPTARASSIRDIRQILYLFYKYELPYSNEQEHDVIAQFLNTEHELADNDILWSKRTLEGAGTLDIARRARYLLSKLFALFDPLDITPRHGPGAVAGKQQLWDKYRFMKIPDRITDMYPLDAYFFASQGHVCDKYSTFKGIVNEESSARVILVPKDSRGPRLISAEPVENQWIQQGLSRAIVDLVERHPLTRFNVHFTDQQPNQFGALLGSFTGKYATLDLKEASDRISVELVRLLFPSRILPYLEACRSSSTVLPDGSRYNGLRKFAPMGSSLCFPILALTIWALLSAMAPDADTRERILVYGDDVIVPTAKAVNAIELLESFGLKINRDKSCIAGSFRESCGVDAFKGENVTPVRLRTVWSSSRCPDVYTSWIAYANSFYDRRYLHTFGLISENLHRIYGQIPEDSLHCAAPSLRWVPLHEWLPARRWNKNLQKFEYRCWDVKSPVINHEMDGWSMLLRYFTEGNGQVTQSRSDNRATSWRVNTIVNRKAFAVRSYTKRGTSMLVRRWR